MKGAFALDDAYVAGRVAEGLGFERSDAAEAAVRLAASYGGRARRPFAPPASVGT